MKKQILLLAHSQIRPVLTERETKSSRTKKLLVEMDARDPVYADMDTVVTLHLDTVDLDTVDLDTVSSESVSVDLVTNSPSSSLIAGR